MGGGRSTTRATDALVIAASRHHDTNLISYVTVVVCGVSGWLRGGQHDHRHPTGKKGGGLCRFVTHYGAKAKESFQTALQHIYMYRPSCYHYRQYLVPYSSSIFIRRQAHGRAIPSRIKSVLVPPCKAAQGIPEEMGGHWCWEALQD